MHPAAWILWATLAGITALLTTNPLYLGLICAVSWLVFCVHRTGDRSARSFRIFLWAGVLAVAVRTTLVLFTAIAVDGGSFSFDPGRIEVPHVVHAMLEGFRLGTMLIVFGTFNAVTDPYGVIRLAPRRFHEPAVASALALSIAPKTIAAVVRVREAQTLRGIHVHGLRTLPALAVPVLETGMEEAVTLAESMDARGHGHGRRSQYRPQRWGPAAIWTVAGAAACTAVFLAARIVDAPSLEPSTDPLGLPPVAPGLVFALLALAVPALFPPAGRR
jgi:energy-coupling factor transport system permease protein